LTGVSGALQNAGQQHLSKLHLVTPRTRHTGRCAIWTPVNGLLGSSLGSPHVKFAGHRHEVCTRLFTAHRGVFALIGHRKHRYASDAKPGIGGHSR